MVNGQASKILVVDDDESNLLLIENCLNQAGYQVVTAKDGAVALEVVGQNSDLPMAILLDRRMPGMNGMELLEKLKSNPQTEAIPVIMQTALDDKDEVIQGIDAGVHYYLTKPLNTDLLLSIVKAAIEDYETELELRNQLYGHKQTIQSIVDCELVFSKFSEVANIALFLSDLFPEPGKVAMGVQEMVRNAIEHGNLAITYDEKTVFIEKNILIPEIEKREASPEYQDRKVRVYFRKSDDEWVLRIVDEGEGFDWQQYMEVSPERVTHNHGRGIAMANLCCFDSIEYVGKGNEVICTVRKQD